MMTARFGATLRAPYDTQRRVRRRVELSRNVLYTDGKEGDLWDDEMIKWCIDRVDGTAATPIIKTDRPTPVIADETPLKGESAIVTRINSP